jgi:hypothetical protein
MPERACTSAHLPDAAAILQAVRSRSLISHNDAQDAVKRALVAHPRMYFSPKSLSTCTWCCAVAAMNAAGLVPICYFSTQYESWRPGNTSFPASALGSSISGWAGERYVDIRRQEIRDIMTAVRRHCYVMLCYVILVVTLSGLSMMHKMKRPWP